MTKLTRREVIAGLPTVAVVATAGVAGAAAALTGDSYPVINRVITGVKTPAPVPTAEELQCWETRYKARYVAQHRARNHAIAMHGTDDVPLRLDLAAEKAEAELDAAVGLVTLPVQAIAGARDQGFGDRRAGRPATANPYWDALSKSLNHGYDGTYDEFMAWYAGWVQADPDLKLPRTAGYTPPQPYICTCCGQPEGSMHTTACADQNPIKPYGLFVRRPRPPGATFT